MNWAALLRFTPAFDPRLLAEERERAVGLMVNREGLMTLPGQEGIPAIVDHDFEQRIGVVRSMFTEVDYDDRRWNFASVDLDAAPPPWLRRGTGVSWGYKAFGKRDALWDGKTTHVTGAFILEVSVLRAMKPEQHGAMVVWVGERPEPARREPADEVIYGGATIVRPAIGQVLAVGGKPLRVR